jgi:hypothetical protein
MTGRGLDKIAAQKRAGHDLIEEAARQIRSWDENGALGPPRYANCRRHLRACQVVPYPGRQRQRLYVHGAGVTCVDWSARGQHQGWCGPNAMAYLQWVVERLIADDDIILVECGPLFDVQRGLVAFFGHKYVVTPLIFSPTYLGYPTTRKRLYAILTRCGRVSCPGEGERSLPQLFEALFRRAASLPGSTFFRAPQNALDAFQHRMARARGLAPVQDDGSAWPFQTLLAPGRPDIVSCGAVLCGTVLCCTVPHCTVPALSCTVQHCIAMYCTVLCCAVLCCAAGLALSKVGHLQRWRERAASETAHGAQPAEICVDIMQTPGHTSPSHWLPTLLKNSLIWSSAHRRPMMGAEKLEAMGLPAWPPPGFRFPHRWAALVPGGSAADPRRVLSEHAVGAIAGNATHLGTIGAILLLVLGCARCEDEAARKAQEDEAAKKAEEDEAARKAQEDEAAKKAEEDEAAKKAEEGRG